MPSRRGARRAWPGADDGLTRGREARAQVGERPCQRGGASSPPRTAAEACARRPGPSRGGPRGRRAGPCPGRRRRARPRPLGVSPEAPGGRPSASSTPALRSPCELWPRADRRRGGVEAGGPARVPGAVLRPPPAAGGGVRRGRRRLRGGRSAGGPVRLSGAGVSRGPGAARIAPVDTAAAREGSSPFERSSTMSRARHAVPVPPASGTGGARRPERHVRRWAQARATVGGRQPRLQHGRHRRVASVADLPRRQGRRTGARDGRLRHEGPRRCGRSPTRWRPHAGDPGGQCARSRGRPRGRALDRAAGPAGAG